MAFVSSHHLWLAGYYEVPGSSSVVFWADTPQRPVMSPLTGYIDVLVEVSEFFLLSTSSFLICCQGRGQFEKYIMERDTVLSHMRSVVWPCWWEGDTEETAGVLLRVSQLESGVPGQKAEPAELCFPGEQLCLEQGTVFLHKTG
ncbi:unnamed protein product [Caretta caretta]